MAEISLKITVPSDVVREAKASRVQLPAKKGVITILPDRAPMELLLQDGVLHLLDEQAVPFESYFVKSGVAHVASDSCIVAAEEVVSANEITLAEAEKCACDESLSGSRRCFYSEIARILKLKK